MPIRDFEKTVTCPYDKTHKILPIRMPTHLFKCARQHPVLASKMKTCSFNATHIVPAAELTVHEGQCENRMALLEVMYSSSNGSRIIDNTSPVTTQADMEPRVEEPSQENWDTQEHYISYDPSIRKPQHVIPKTPPGLSKSQRRRWREEQREKREKGREQDKKDKLITQIRQIRQQARGPSPVPRAGSPRYPSPFEAARPASPKMSQSRRLFSPASTRSSLGYASRAKNGHDISSSDDEEFGLAAAATGARARTRISAEPIPSRAVAATTGRKLGEPLRRPACPSPVPKPPSHPRCEMPSPPPSPPSERSSRPPPPPPPSRRSPRPPPPPLRRAPGTEVGDQRPLGVGRGRAQLVVADMAARRVENEISAYMERLKISE